ncbi:MAG: acyl--CoA ligase [bacterium]|nr:acyl--CoA ligase [bacterium]
MVDLMGAADAPAIGAPGRQSMSYRDLARQVCEIRDFLGHAGLADGDRVALVLPNGPEMASAFLGVAAGLTAAPLNPAYRGDEFRFYLEDLDARLLIVEEGSESDAVAVARDLGMGLAQVCVAENARAGAFTLRLREEPDPRTVTHDAGTALVLHTSGTTSRPKIVPLSRDNLAASATNIAQSLALSFEDRALNIMPLFHIHGLVGAVLSTMRAGASVYCAPGFNPLKFFSWCEDIRPTWYTAVPTMHQAILARAPRNVATLASLDLRLIRSSSASLPSRVMEELEATFGCPVIESYGMTEASHQMTSNPLPPAPRHAGSVGIAAGPEVAIMDEERGHLLQAGETGEVVIRGANVTHGYENNDDANGAAFVDGWFRTGDQGLLDDRGYLWLTGRLKEIINRGGEKISPLEVDEVLMAHPAVDQAVTFAVPHATLGEDVAVAVVPRDGEAPSEASLRSFAGARLAAFKVPRQVIILDEIPKGATGKLQRIGLAATLGLAS